MLNAIFHTKCSISTLHVIFSFHSGLHRSFNSGRITVFLKGVIDLQLPRYVSRRRWLKVDVAVEVNIGRFHVGKVKLRF